MHGAPMTQVNDSPSVETFRVWPGPDTCGQAG
jgi:hypothetical protein